ncbi:glycoside hydrolase family 32 protein [Paenibacillus sp. strain BS8-2]
MMHNLSSEQSSSLVDRYRLSFHFMPAANWMNDPNGLIYFKGYYHLFYQHHPFSPYWGAMHWGHAISKDGVYWSHLPIALYPDESYDCDGCFSGCAVDNQGKLTLIYTGNINGEDNIQSQCAAQSEDGIHFEKYKQNPVIGFNPDGDLYNFRDPKVWMQDGLWHLIVGSSKEGRGRILLFRSEDLCSWHYSGVMAESDGDEGDMWECPDLFQIGDHHVLILSPMNMPGHRNIWKRGRFHTATGQFLTEEWGDLDYGHDFYAAQSFQDDQGRRIVIGWMDSWTGDKPTQQHGWSGAFTIPRVIELAPDGKPLFKPLPELQQLRQAGRRDEAGLIAEQMSVTADLTWTEECFEVHMQWVWTNSSLPTGLFHVRLVSDADCQEEICMTFALDRKTMHVVVAMDILHAEIGDHKTSICKCAIGPEWSFDLQLFVDRSSIELFLQGGEAVITNRIYPLGRYNRMLLQSVDGEVDMVHWDWWKLKDIWI